MNTYILIDISYMIFYRITAVLSWYKRAYIHNEKYDIQIINDKFKKRFLENIKELSKKYNVPFHHILLCFDCPQHLIWRKKIYPSYKKTRKVNEHISKAFEFFNKEIEPELNKLGILSFKVNNAEGDDVIAIISKELSKTSKIIIISSDKDFIQLLNENTVIITLNNKYLHYDLDLQLKIIMGDKSDNIKSCLKHSGIKTDLKSIENNLEYLKQTEAYKLNERLIDFHFIPDIIQQKIKKK